MGDNQSVFDVTARSLSRLGEVMERERPDVVLVQGDTTTVMTGALAAYYLRIPIGHVEAGLRTGDKYNPFPEEINRVFADLVADLLFAPTEGAKHNLLVQGVDPDSIFVTGNTAIDALLDVAERLSGMDGADGMLEGIPESLRDRLENGASPQRMVLVTGHRRESFGEDLENICVALGEIARRNPDVELEYPVHQNPNLHNPVHKILGDSRRVHLLEPLGYAPFVWLMKRSYLVLTD
ncbi:MAG: UDP-N-acetylglucosamine 2-epimerase (non-hydrolyzing), partial [Dehalococcoidia bacterium]|nr:UDP-N-acetylglucosamine 2-epimerase (non-hydrolyzing) [Dehalococcoidia bacterium]